ncbi:ankyrin repeat domain-containing protein [Niabella pedocola]|uniref:Ankyrin repeat domain-containing protein n=1 Tax=Niabella pedocola TaxID=1752077 RepID=A0ABS8PUM3_9BACT|nr:ankyrin repeat domain-containing protein [Niabella pedocola]MCD2423606.1 ankyrin repeat domain-containing protein [Niabella pedocola]
MHYLLLVYSIWILNACQAKTNSADMNTQRINIIEAVEKNQLSVVEAGLKKGADANTTDKNKRSLLLIATQANNLQMATLLVAHGANVNQQDQIKDSPFLYAGAAGFTELVKLFLAHGARFDLFNRYNGTALIPACERGHIDVVKILANTKGFPVDHVNRLGWTALMEAVVLGNGSEKYVTVVQLLVNAGCNIQIPDHDGVTALQHARSRGYTEIAGVLENASAKKNGKE